MIGIPRFTQNEIEELVVLLKGSGIPFELKGVSGAVSRFRGTKDYIICVSEEAFSKTIEALKLYYGFIDGSYERFTGSCPACQAEAVDAAECSECGLAFVTDPYELMAGHPFCIFLKKLEAQNGAAPKGFY
jgi:hypothetical protein